MNKVTTYQQDQHAGCAAPCMAVCLSWQRTSLFDSAHHYSTAHIIIPSPSNFIGVTYYI